MIAPILALLVQAAPGPATPILEAIGRQAMPEKGCAAFLWTAGPRRTLVAMATADPAQLRLRLDGKTLDVARAAQAGTAGYGFASRTEYRRAEVTAVLDLTVEARPDLRDGAVAPAATLRIERPGRDVLIAPVAGIIGCRQGG